MSTLKDMGQMLQLLKQMDEKLGVVQNMFHVQEELLRSTTRTTSGYSGGAAAENYDCNSASVESGNATAISSDFGGAAAENEAIAIDIIQELKKQGGSMLLSKLGIWCHENDIRPKENLTVFLKKLFEGNTGIKFTCLSYQDGRKKPGTDRLELTECRSVIYNIIAMVEKPMRLSSLAKKYQETYGVPLVYGNKLKQFLCQEITEKNIKGYGFVGELGNASFGPLWRGRSWEDYQ